MSARAVMQGYAGQCIASSLPLPELPAWPDATARPAFRIRQAVLPHCSQRRDLLWRHDFLESGSIVTLTCARTAQGHLLEFPGTATLEADHDGDLQVSPWPGASVESVRHVLLDQALPRLIAQRGDFVLHGAAIRTAGDRAIVVLGDSGMGKSTLAAAFACSGAEVLTDDGACVETLCAAPLVVPTYAGLRLWPDSLRQLFPTDSARSTPMAHYSDKRRLSLETTQRTVSPLAGIFVLRPPAGPDIQTQALGAQQACMVLVRNAFQLDLGDPAHVDGTLAHAARLASRVPVSTLAYPRDYARLPEVIAFLTARTG